MEIKCQGKMGIEFYVFTDANFKDLGIFLVEIPNNEPKSGVNRIWNNEIGPNNLIGYADWKMFEKLDHTPAAFAQLIIEKLLTPGDKITMHRVPFIEIRG